MDIRRKIGQMLMFGWQGGTTEDNLTVSAHARTLTEDFAVGGVILLGRNVQSPEQVANTLNELQALSDTPLLVAADQEGGLITRFKDPFTNFPGNMALGATRSAEYSRKAARAIARELTAVGVNVNFAPCVDVNINPHNPIIGIRSYGECPELVSELGVAAVEGYQESGVVACAKHFPGHGDTSVDSHLALPAIHYGRKRLDRVELRPFRAAIAAGVASVMTTHIAFTALDGDLPATLSHAILTKLLREEMGFNGLIVTDCLEMKAIADNYGPADAAILCVKAGVDILLACHTLEFQTQMRDALLAAVESGEISEQRIDESVTRIMAAKERFQLESRRFVDVKALEAAIGTQENRKLESEIARKALTVLRNKDNLLPLRLRPADRIAVIGAHPATELFAESIRRHHPNTRHARVSTSPSAEELSEIGRLLRESRITLLTTSPSEPWIKTLGTDGSHNDAISQVLQSNDSYLIVAAREPYDLRHYPDAPASIATYGYPPVTVDAAVDLLFGKVKPSGRLPVTVPGIAEFGDGARGFNGSSDA